MNTDDAWEEWGRREPYFGVFTNPKYRRNAMSDEARREFFESGRLYADHVMNMIRLHVDADFRPQSILDFGCAVGRVLIPFARIAKEVVGLDVSTSMLAEARRNCDEQGAPNVKLLVSDDSLSRLEGTFDLIHSVITFQHIPPERGKIIFRELLTHLNAGGVAAVQFTYAKAWYAATNGVAPPAIALPGAPASAPPEPVDPAADPEMQMNSYPMSELLFIVQRSGVDRFHAEFTDHGGEMGLFLFLQKS